MPIWGGGAGGTASSVASGVAAALTGSTRGLHHAGSQKSVCVKLWDGELQLNVEAKAKVQDLYEQVCFMLSIKEAQLFGLTILRDNGEFEFLDLKTKISKYAPKGWKSDSNDGSDKSGKPLLVFYLKVQLYVEHVSLLKDDVTRHHYYLQLKQNFLQAPVQCREEACFVLASYALQADLGNYTEAEHSGRYFEPANYFPEWVIRRRGENYILKHVPAMHQDQVETTPAHAEKAFFREAASTAEHCMHFYMLKKTKTEQIPSIWLGVCTKGIYIYENCPDGKYLLCEYAWGDIKRLIFQKKKFELVVEGVSDGRKITYYTCNEAKSKHLLRLCKLTHAFQMKTQSLVDQARKRETKSEKKRYRESYISGDISWSDLDSSMTTTSHSEMSKIEQRLSVISNVSSVATSGIVSDERSPMDKMHSEDELSSTHKAIEASSHIIQLETHHSLPPSASKEDFLHADGISKRHSAAMSDTSSYSKRHSAAMSDTSSYSKRHSAALSDASSHSKRHSLAMSDASSYKRHSAALSDVSSHKRHSAAMSDASSHKEHNATHSSSSSSEPGKTGNVQGQLEGAAMLSESEWASDDEAEDDDEDEQRYHKKHNNKSSNFQPQLIDTRKIRAEIADKDVTAPLLSALCNDRSLMMMQQQQQQLQKQQQALNATTHEDNSLDSNDLSRTSSSRGSGSVHERSLYEELNNSLTTLVSHSSVDSDMHSSVVDRRNGNANSCSMLNTLSSYSLGLVNSHHLSKHQTVSTLNNLADMDFRLVDTSPFDVRSSFDAASDIGLTKCKTLPSKMNASEQMLLLGASFNPMPRDESVSFSAPNLSPGAQVPIASH